MAGKTQAILARHVDVDQRQVDRVLRGQCFRGGGAFGAERRIAVRGEVFLQHLAHVRLVIDDQEGGFGAHGRIAHLSDLPPGEGSHPRRADVQIVQRLRRNGEIEARAATR